MRVLRALSQIKTRQKVLLGASLPLVMLLVVGGVGIVNINSMVKSNQKVTEAEEILASANDMVAHATDMVTSVRGYMLAGKESFLDPYHQRREQTLEEIRDLEHRVASDPDQFARLKKVEEIIQRWQEQVAEPSIKLRRLIGDAETMNDLADLVKKAEGEVFFNDFRAVLGGFKEREDKSLEERRDRFSDASMRLQENVTELQSAFHKLDETHRLLEHLEIMEASAATMESGMRGYLLTGKSSDLAPYKKARKHFLDSAKHMETAFSGQNEDLRKVRDLIRVVQRWDNNVVQTLFGLRKQVTAGTMTHKQLQTIVSKQFGRSYFEKFRKNIHELRDKEMALIETYSEQTAQAEMRVDDAITIMEHEESQVSVSNRIAVLSGQVMEAALNMATGVRGYLLAGEDGFLAPYQQGEKTFFDRTAELKHLVRDVPEQVAALEQAEQLVMAWGTQVIKPMISLRQKIGDAATMDDMADLVRQEKGRKMMDEFRQTMAEFGTAERDLIEVLKAGNERTELNTYMWVAGFTLAALLLGLGIAWLVGSGISAPLVRMTDEMRRLAGGDTGIKISGSKRQDEIGDMAAALKVFRDNALQKERLMREQEKLEVEKAVRAKEEAQRQAEEEARRRELETAAEREKTRAMADLANKFESTIGSVVEAVASSADELQQAATTMSASADQTNSQAEMARERTVGTLENVRSVSGAAEELNGSIAEIARQVTLSTDTASRAVEEADNTGEVVGGLSDMVGKIGQVLEIISDIAAQTNLLALNATIEAARAGDAGKGFAVVASEVKNLAGQTARATEEIASHITAVQGATGDTVNAMTLIGSTIAEVSSGIDAIAAAIEEQGMATATISGNVASAAEGSEEVATSISTVRDAATNSGAAAQQVLSAAEVMDEQSDRLNQEVKKFLAEVRAG